MSSGYGLRPIFLADPRLPAKLVKVPDIINSEDVLLWVLIVVIHVLNWTLTLSSMEGEKGGFPTTSFLERKTRASAHPAPRYARREIFDTLKTDDIQNRGVKSPVLPPGLLPKKKPFYLGTVRVQALMAIDPRSSPPSAVALLRRTGERGIPAFSRKHQASTRVIAYLVSGCKFKWGE